MKLAPTKEGEILCKMNAYIDQNLMTQFERNIPNQISDLNV